MPSVEFQIFGRQEDGTAIKKIDIDCDFLPNVGDVFNTYNLFDDIEAEGNHFSIVYKIDWSIAGNRAVPIVKLYRYQGRTGDRYRVLQRYEWLPPNSS
jgi:hypothetical protein